MGNIQKIDRARRTYVVRELYGLGLSASQIAPSMDWSQATITQDIRRLGGPKAFPNRPMRRGEIFRAVLGRYAQLMTELGRDDDGVVLGDKDAIRLALAQWLQESRILNALEGVVLMLAHLRAPAFRANDWPRAHLLGAILGIRVSDSLDEQLLSLPSPKELWRGYLDAIDSGKESVPQHLDQLVSALVRFALDEYRKQIKPIWGKEVFAILDMMLDRIPLRQENVIRSRFGIDMDRPKTLVQVASELGVTGECVRQREAHAMRNLRSTARKLKLGVIGDPVGNAVEQELARRRVAESEAVQQTVVTEFDMVQECLREVQELELMARTANCLQDADILLIGELVQKTSADLLRTKNFGRKSLLEVNELLGERGLKLGMELSDELKAQIARRREQILAKRQNH